MDQMPTGKRTHHRETSWSPRDDVALRARDRLGGLERQTSLERELGDALRRDSSARAYRSVYNRFHDYILNYGIQGDAPRGYIYKGRLSILDKVLVRLVGEGKRVLDIGCGDGLLAAEIGKRNNVSAVDISDVALINARIGLRRLGSSTVSFCLADARCLPFRDEVFDCVLAKDLVEHLAPSDFLQHISEVHRLLTRGGHYILWTPSRLLGPSSLGLHLREYSLSCVIEALSEKLVPAVIFPQLGFVGINPISESRVVLSALMAYEAAVERTRLSRLAKRMGPAGYFLVPPVLVRARKAA